MAHNPPLLFQVKILLISIIISLRLFTLRKKTIPVLENKEVNKTTFTVPNAKEESL